MKYAPFITVMALSGFSISGCATADMSMSPGGNPSHVQPPSSSSSAPQSPVSESTDEYFGNENCERFSVSAYVDLKKHGFSCEAALVIMGNMTLEQAEQYLDDIGIESYFTSEQQLQDAAKGIKQRVHSEVLENFRP